MPTRCSPKTNSKTVSTKLTKSCSMVPQQEGTEVFPQSLFFLSFVDMRYACFHKQDSACPLLETKCPRKHRECENVLISRWVRDDLVIMPHTNGYTALSSAPVTATGLKIVCCTPATFGEEVKT